MYRSIHLKMISVKDIKVDEYDISFVATVDSEKFQCTRANALRRSLEEETPMLSIKYVTFFRYTSNIDETQIAHRLGQCPLLQDELANDGDHFSFNWVNKTDDVIYITTSDIRGLNFAEENSILPLCPGEHIQGIVTVAIGKGRENKCYSPTANVGFTEVSKKEFIFNLRHNKSIPDDDIEAWINFHVNFVNETPEQLRSNPDKLHRLIMFDHNNKRVVY